MLNRISAEKCVLEFINQEWKQKHNDDELMIDSAATIEKPYGWIFFYQSKRHLGTRDLRYALAGNGPVVIEKESGKIFQLGTGMPIEKCLEEFEASRAEGCTWKYEPYESLGVQKPKMSERSKSKRR